jgi:hypothetical protein
VPQPVSKRFGVGTEKVCVVARFWIIQKAKLWQIQKLRSKLQKIATALARLFFQNVHGFSLKAEKTLSMEIIMQRWRLALVGAALLAGTAAFPSVGRADTFNLTSCHLSAGCGTVTQFGTVELTQTDATTVHFNVVLNSGNLFVETGAGAGQLFLFSDTISGSTITNITATFNGADTTIDPGGLVGITNQVDKMGNATLMANGTGDFSAGIHCATSNTCNGSSGVDANDLHFDVTNATLSQLEVLNDKGNLFVADIFCGQTGCSNSTGPVDAVPGPILGAGLPGLVAACFGLVTLARRRRKLVV